MNKAFDPDETVEVLRSPSAREWEIATYSNQIHAMKGWHLVVLPIERARWIDMRTGFETSSTSPGAMLNRALAVPSRRIRKHGTKENRT